MALQLPDITLVVIDTHAHLLAKAALERTFQQIRPAETLVYSNHPNRIVSDSAPINTATLTISPLKGFADLNNFLWGLIPYRVKTSHMLIIQYDGWVRNAEMWNSEWLTYDYIGAPWPWHDSDRRVGNGGFSLRSTRLMRFLAQNQIDFPVAHPEDDTLCHIYRTELESKHDFRWAPLSVATQFSFERESLHPTFGFHGIFNVPKVLDPTETHFWKALAPQYVKDKVEWQEISR